MVSNLYLSFLFFFVQATGERDGGIARASSWSEAR